MGKKVEQNGAYEFTRAAHDELADCMHKYKVACAVALLPAQERGFWLLVVEAFDLDQIASERPVCSWQGYWPNAGVQSFEAFLYSASHRLVRMVEAWAAQDTAREVAATA